MRKIITGVAVGMVAGIIDVIPMIIQKLSIDADLSAFVMWVAVGFFISTSELKIPGILKGIVVSYLAVLPILIIVGFKEPFSLIPITTATLILGGLSGFVIEKINKNIIR